MLDFTYYIETKNFTLAMICLVFRARTLPCNKPPIVIAFSTASEISSRIQCLCVISVHHQRMNILVTYFHALIKMAL